MADLTQAQARALISLAQVRALNALASTAQSALAREGKPELQRKALARLNVLLEVCDGLGIYEEAQSIADQAGITPELIDRLTDPDVWELSERMINEVPNG